MRAIRKSVLVGVLGQPVAENPGVNNLKKFWTKDPEGLAKWAEKPHPWKTLRNHLLRVAPQLGEEKAFLVGHVFEQATRDILKDKYPKNF